MRKGYLIVFTALCVCAVQSGKTRAQQAPAANSSQSAPAKSQTAPAAKTPATKPAHPAAAGTATAAKPSTLTTEKDKVSYAIGMNIGRGLSRDSVDIDPNILLQGIKDVLAGGKTQMTDDDVKAALTTLQAEVNKRNQEKTEALGEANKKEGEAFFAENKTKEGVVSLPSGLQYKILQAGTGPKPALTDTVVCNYRGTLINGTEFDSSYKRGQPADFEVGKIIPGWTEALQLMPVGSKWQLFVPANLAYGERSPSPLIGPNATLIFEVELLSIQPKTQPDSGRTGPNLGPHGPSVPPSGQPTAPVAK